MHINRFVGRKFGLISGFKVECEVSLYEMYHVTGFIFGPFDLRGGKCR
jgi:hypothetical protein